MAMTSLRMAALLCTLAVAACGGRAGDKTEGRTASRSDSAGGMMGMPGMDSGKGMGGMGMPMQSMKMMGMMRTHMDSMMHASPQQMRSMMAQHDAMMSQTMDQMGGDMRAMNMGSDAQWSALTDSVKRDLAELPALDGKALADRMRAHAGRVERLLTMHERMMGGRRSQ
jgi:hypothetical protein